MGDTEIPRPLLAQLAWRFHPRTEEVAVAALAHILNRYPASREGLDELLRRAVPDLRLSDERFQTEVSFPDGARPDVLQKGLDGQSRLMIEAKFHAWLTPNQPVRYLKWLPEDGVSVLAFLAPSGRVEELWPQLLHRLDKKSIPHSDAGPRCVAIDGTGKHLLITDWTTLLSRMESRLHNSESGLAELRQLSGLARFAEANEPKSRHAGERLVKQVVEIGRNAGWLDTKGLSTTTTWSGYARYVWLGRHAKLGVCVGFSTKLHEEFKRTPIWIRVRRWKAPYDSGWTDRTVPTLKERMSPYVKQVGKVLWVGVVPEGPADPTSYAEELERIAAIVDEAAERQLSRASVLAEVGRRYSQPVMNNVHRSEYVEALVALALRDGGWTRKTPWDAWHFENESGVRLKLKHSAAAQSWGSGKILSAPRFNIASVKQYWDEEGGRYVDHDGRPAEIYVFAWHGAPREKADQGDPSSWEFYVVAERDLPEQKSIALKALQNLTSPCGIDALAAAVDAGTGRADERASR